MEKALQQPLGGFGVAANLNDFIEDVTVLVDGAPEIALVSADQTTTSSRCQTSRRPGFLRFRRRA